MLRAADRLLQLSTALVRAGRVVDLSGLEMSVGRLVAAILDLDPGVGPGLLPFVIGLLASLDRLQAAMLQATLPAEACHDPA